MQKLGKNKMFSTIKAYINLIIGAIVLGFLAYLKYLKSSNDEQKENIERLKKEIEVRGAVAKDEVKKQVFEAKQKERVKKLAETEITLDAIEQEIKQNTNDEAQSDDDFVTMRV